MLGIREETDATLPNIHAHRPADVGTPDSHRFMFGVAAEQEPVMPPQEPVFCFWRIGAV